MTTEATIERNLAWLADLYANDRISLSELERLAEVALKGQSPAFIDGLGISLPPGPERTVRR
jgi:hypothetical protein